MRQRHPKSVCHNCHGFTLLEVLVAFVIFVIVGGVTLEALGSGLRTARLSSQYGHAILLAQGKIETLRAQKSIETGSNVGVFDEVYGWKTEVVAYNVEPPGEPADGLSVLPFRLDVEVFWSEGRQRHAVHLVTLALTLPENEG